MIIITDDLAWGDLASHGNPFTRTPHLDALRNQSVRLERHCSGPLCTPARASLMTGRYAFRTRAFDTYLGRSMLDPGEVTLAEILRGEGYRTGIFGKWHLGDCHPMRAIDKGFEEALVHNGGGLRQPANPTPNDGYFNPDLMHNGQVERSTGYCTDIFSDAAIRFIQQNRAVPFFAYLATNAPHSPFEVDERWVGHHRDQGLNETWARVYGMVENIDANVGRVLASLDEAGLARDTLVLFTSDHGPCGSASHGGQIRFNAGLRGIKGSLYEGGIRVPCFWRWPAALSGNGSTDRVTSPIDVLPTIAAACGGPLPADRVIDGVDLLPLLRDPTRQDSWPDRPLLMQWHRGDHPVRYRNAGVITQRHKLYRPHEDKPEELYDLSADPGEQTNLAPQHPQIAASLRRLYDAWFDDVSATRGPSNYDPPRIHVGSPRENPVRLTRQDWRVVGPDGWTDQHLGFWEIFVAHPGAYRLLVRVPPAPNDQALHLRCGSTSRAQSVPAGAGESWFEGIALHAGEARLESWIEADGRHAGVRGIEVWH
ncbi:MAG: arylsulfatase [Planctomycetota bacterium]|nr:arylsulfatase [Planctomycetota bacterium]